MSSPTLSQTVRDQLAAVLEKTDQLLPAVDRVALTQDQARLQQLSLQPDFWQKPEAKSTMQQLSLIEGKLAQLDEVIKQQQDVVALQELMEESGATEQTELEAELVKSLRQLETAVNKLELSQFLSGPYDAQGAIVSIHSGQGGTEAMDWADMVRRMYVRYFERQGWKHALIEESRGDEAGIKAAVYQVTAPYAYGYLKGEAGTHRLVRQSPFNADNLRQTSFALVEVLPIVDESDASIEIKDEELEWQFSRSGGAGGQNVNKVNTAVQLTHLPTGIVVKCRQERTQYQNKEVALLLLKSQLAQRQAEAQAAELAQLKGEHHHASWGNQIRNYVLHPYKLVKDTRTQVETSDTEAVLDGDLEAFIMAELTPIA